ncbi:MAG: 50S ribosomal protein L6 [Planctomycetota bacterium]
MSRIGKNPVPIASGATVQLQGRTLSVNGKLGSLSLDLTHHVKVEVDEGDKVVTVTRANNSRPARAMHGTTRQLIANMIQGVTEGYKKELEVNGVGYTAQVKGMEVHLKVGYADTRIVQIPDGVTVAVTGPIVTVTGASKQLVGQTAAKIRAERKPEPYNGKGIRYRDEVILRKQGKAFGK